MLADQLLQHSWHTAYAEAGIGFKRETLARVRTDYAQDSHHASGRQAVDDEVHRPLVIGYGQLLLCGALTHQTLAPLTSHHQTFFDMKPIDSLHVHLTAYTAQHACKRP